MSSLPPIADLPAPLADLIDATMAEVRALVPAGGPDRADLESIRDVLLKAAAARDLFTLAHFPIDPRTRDAIYLLSEDPDRRLALYLGIRDAALATPVHDHTTWASVVGVHGCERNRFFERVPGGARETGAADVVPGTGIAMADADLHCIATDAGVLNMQLHLYGRSFDAQGGRVVVDVATGEERRFGGHPDVRVPRGRLTPAMLRRMIDDGEELAVLDLRPPADHSELGHPLVAANLPLEVFAQEIAGRCPNRRTRIVLLDDDGLAAPAAAALERAGYERPYRLPGGSEAWQSAGYALFEGINVPGKAFGEHLEHAGTIPTIDASTLAARRRAGEPMVLVDCRTPAEHRRMTIHGSVNLPGAEVLTRIRALAADPAVPIIVHCAGRTRGLVAVRTLIDAGCPNPVMALDNGLIGWLLAGEPMEIAGGRPVPAPGEPLPGPQSEVARIDGDTLRRWLDDPSRTTYLFDVRSAEEFAAGHAAGARHAPAGELLQQLDAFVPVRRSRVVIAGDDVRARSVAALLAWMDWCEPALLSGGVELVRGAGPTRPALPRGWRPPFDEHEQDPARMRAYIDWELGLLQRLAADGSLAFRDRARS
jgi:rhodanese-related sulfurtransferase/predicted metal-dependent enzyme (double-stranded beta helix superfamily)